ncbi:MAG: NADPH-dependent F420 reductase [Actinomycetota bacterium]
MTTYGVLGTGTVGRAISEKLVDLGHDVRMGTRQPDATRARTEPDERGRESAASWLERNLDVELLTYADAAGAADVVVNATSGSASIDVLRSAGAANLGSKIVIDIANPLDFSSGQLSLSIGVTDSLAETIQREFPDVRVVKTLNTVTARVMVEPESVAGGDHTMFVAGNDDAAKAEVTELLRSFGWRDVLDLGDVSAARGLEAYLLLWIRGMQTIGAMFNVKVQR